MSERKQVILKIAGLVAVAGLMGLLLYLMIFSDGPSLTPPAEVEPSQTLGTLPTPGTGTPGGGQAIKSDGPGGLKPSAIANGGLTAVTRLTTASVLEPTITASGNLAYYDPRDGKFYTVDADGNVVSLSAKTFPQAENIVFANDAQAAVIEFPDGSNVIFDFQTGAQTTLPTHWEDFDFSADGSEIASKSIGTDPSNRSLVVTATDGSKTKVIAPLGANDNLVAVSWSPDGNIVGFSKTGNGGSAFGQNEIYLIGEDGEAAGVLIVNGTNFKNLWSPDGNNLIYSIADAGDDYRSSLWYGDAQGDRTGDTRLRLGLKTSADKCTFAGDSLAYCAVPLSMPIGGGSAPSLITSPDYLYSLSLPSGRTTLIAIPAEDTQMFNLSITSNGDQLYFTDTYGRINLIQLD